MFINMILLFPRAAGPIILHTNRPFHLVRDLIVDSSALAISHPPPSLQLNRLGDKLEPPACVAHAAISHPWSDDAHLLGVHPPDI